MVTFETLYIKHRIQRNTNIVKQPISKPRISYLLFFQVRIILSTWQFVSIYLVHFFENISVKQQYHNSPTHQKKTTNNSLRYRLALVLYLRFARAVFQFHNVKKPVSPQISILAMQYCFLDSRLCIKVDYQRGKLVCI